MAINFILQGSNVGGLACRLSLVGLLSSFGHFGNAFSLIYLFEMCDQERKYNALKRIHLGELLLKILQFLLVSRLLSCVCVCVCACVCVCVCVCVCERERERERERKHEYKCKYWKATCMTKRELEETATQQNT